MQRTATLGIVIHNTASPQTQTPQQVFDFHTRTLGHSKGGYNIVYGTRERVMFHDWRTEGTNGIRPNAHMGYNNLNVINLGYIGGLGANNAPHCNITDWQIAQMQNDIEQILRWFPRALIVGHNQINRTACPSFWVPDSIFAHRFPNNIDKREVFGNRAEIRRIANSSNIYAIPQPPTNTPVTPSPAQSNAQELERAAKMLEEAITIIRKVKI